MSDESEPAELVRAATVEFDLEGTKPLDPEGRPFAKAITFAAADAAKEDAQSKHQRMAREALVVAEREVRATVARVQAEYGVAIGFDKLWAYRPKPKAAYELWKRVIPMFVQTPETLKIGPTALANMLAKSEFNFSVTRDMMHARLNPIAIKDAGRLLSKLGVSLTIKKPASIRSIQKQLIEYRAIDLGSTVEEFRGDFRICDDTAYVNGKPYQIQRGASGKRRIKTGGRHWLSLDTVKAFCTKADPAGS